MKNTARFTVEDIRVNENIFMAIVHNATNLTETLHKPISKKYIHFYFCVSGCAVFNFLGNDNKVPVDVGKSYGIYHPSNDLSIHINLQKETKIYLLLTTVDYFYSFFVKSRIHELLFDKISLGQAFYHEEVISVPMLDILMQIENYTLSEVVRSTYYELKAKELIVHYLSALMLLSGKQLIKNQADTDMDKLKKARDLLLLNLAQAPTAESLGQQVGMTMHSLREGFKKAFGKTLYAYHLDAKLTYSRNVLMSSTTTVKSIALELGYENSSHFIAAFKKKYGITPKKFSVKAFEVHFEKLFVR